MNGKSKVIGYKVIISAAIVLGIIMLVFPNQGRFMYEYQKGKPWLYSTLISPIDFPILKTEAELQKEREELSSSIISYYNIDKSVLELRKTVFKVKQKHISNEESLNILDVLGDVYNTGIIAEYDKGSKVIFLQRDKRVKEIPSTEVYDIDRAIYTVKLELRDFYPEKDIDSLYTALALEDYIVPNIIYDQKKTDALHKQAVDYISPVSGMFYTGQLIVSEGELVTAEIEQLLNSYKKEYMLSIGKEGAHWDIMVGHFIYLLLLLGVLLMLMYFLDSQIFYKANQYRYIFLLFLIMIVSTIFVGNLDERFLYIVPYSVLALYLVSFFRPKSAYPLYSVLILPLLILSENGVELYMMNLFAGLVALFSFSFYHRGWLQFINSLFIFASLSVTYITFRLFGDGSLAHLDINIIFIIAANSLLVIAAYPFVFLFEKVFSLISKSRLRDLADTNNKLLQELATKAPGTFQHSLQVANLAVDAAREVGADISLIKAGALYHDIGKINNPQCFVENQAASMNYHKGLSPMESAHQIIRHVDDGLELAKKYKLPEPIVNFISTHHAKTMVSYFYTVYCNDGGDLNNKEPFTYHGKLPQTTEQVIVMMADAVEAASRTLDNYSEKSISDLVDSIVSQRSTDSQLVEADIKIKDINIVKNNFKEHLNHLYHERIVYPKMKKE
ncbi:MAG: HDIG domain-containing metalloprotein [Bacteroidales bacterium]